MDRLRLLEKPQFNRLKIEDMNRPGDFPPLIGDKLAIKWPHANRFNAPSSLGVSAAIRSSRLFYHTRILVAICQSIG
jgi:hypothetical protein